MEISKTKYFGDYRQDPETLQFVRIGTEALTITLEDADHILFTQKKSDGKREKRVTVKPAANHDFIYEIKKTFIRSWGGADGLFSYLSDPDCQGMYLSMFEKVFDYMK